MRGGCHSPHPPLESRSHPTPPGLFVYLLEKHALHFASRIERSFDALNRIHQKTLSNPFVAKRCRICVCIYTVGQRHVTNGLAADVEGYRRHEMGETFGYAILCKAWLFFPCRLQCVLLAMLSLVLFQLCMLSLCCSCAFLHPPSCLHSSFFPCSMSSESFRIGGTGR